MSFTNDKLRDTLEYCMMEGKALIIAGVEEDIDPMLTPVLEKQVRESSRSRQYCYTVDCIAHQF